MSDMTLFDVNVRSTDPATSRLAAESMRGRPLSKQRLQVLLCIQTSGHTNGATAFEVAKFLDLQQSVVARRCTDLKELGLIEDTGVTRPGSTGRQLTVWRATQNKGEQT